MFSEMKQIKIIEHLQKVSDKISNIEAILLIGSFGRKTFSYNSDIDISLLVNENFKEQQFSEEIKKINLPFAVHKVLWVELRNKCVVYFEETTKLEFNICRNIEEIDKYFLGSEISDYKSCILFNKNPFLEKHLQKIIDYKQNNPIELSSLYVKIIDKFIYDFEQFSMYHKRSDAYKTYFHYNLALNDCLQLLQLNKNEVRFLYLPDNKDYFNGIEGRERFRKLAGTLYLPEVNQLKRELLNLFYETIENQNLIKINTAEIKTFLEWIYKRDYAFNFRDIAENCSKIKNGIIYRTSTLTRFQKCVEHLNFILENYSIQKIIDLRANREIEEDPYHKSNLDVEIVEAPFDPWNQSKHFLGNYNYGTDSEITYRFFALECKESIAKVVREIIKTNKGSVAIHCQEGKDRTGCLIALFYLLCGATDEEIYLDYFASETDTKKYKIDSFLSEVRKFDTIEKYFFSCGLSEEEINTLKNKLLK